MKNKKEMLRFWDNVNFDKISDLKKLKTNTVNTTFAINEDLLNHWKTHCKTKGIVATDVYLKSILKELKND